jgi:hypothetical protein
MALEVVEELLSKELTQIESDADYQKTLGQARGSAATYFEGLALQLTKTMSSFVPEIKDIQPMNAHTLRGKVWTPAMKSEVKSIVSCAASSLGLDSLNPYLRGPIDALIVWLEE